MYMYVCMDVCMDGWMENDFVVLLVWNKLKLKSIEIVYCMAAIWSRPTSWWTRTATSPSATLDWLADSTWNPTRHEIHTYIHMSVHMILTIRYSFMYAIYFLCSANANTCPIETISSSGFDGVCRNQILSRSWTGNTLHFISYIHTYITYREIHTYVDAEYSCRLLLHVEHNSSISCIIYSMLKCSYKHTYITNIIHT